MDRRRFVPSAENLEGRQLQASLFGQSISQKNSAPTASANAPDTIWQKEVRIEHLPFYMRQPEPNRFLPRDTITQLQNDLAPLIAKLHKSPPEPLSLFNAILRAAAG